MYRPAKLFIPLLTLLMATMPLIGCSSSASTATAVPLTLNISVAASLTDAIKEVNSLYKQIKPWVTITSNFASSGTLQTQIENGAPCDVFISAAAKQMDNLQSKNRILNDSRKDLLNNKLVLVVPVDSNLDLNSFVGLTNDKVKTIAIGDPSFVPAGTYAQQAFDLLGITTQIQSKLILGSDVRQVLAYVESANVEAGIVYSTDSRISSRVRVVASAPDEINSKIVYPVTVIKASQNVDAAEEYIDFLFSAQPMLIFEKYGFSRVVR